MAQTIVVTGASAGIGRAIAELYGARGANVGLLARGRVGLEQAAAEIERAGGRAIVCPTDVSDYAKVREAARRVEESFEPIDVWINVAFATVFAPFSEISPEEYRRVTEVSYLGFVYGTHVALELMRPRDHGTIVQVGSALGVRSIPLQSAYCGAKHAINGFTSSIRTELMHDKSSVKITVAQMPGVNTPQFTWVLNKLPHHAQPVPPIYQPEIAARGAVFAADHPNRKQYYVGDTTALTVLAEKFISPLLDRYLAKTGYKSQQTDEEISSDQPNNLWSALDGVGGRDYGAHGEFDQRAQSHSPELWLSHHAKAVSIGAGTAGVIGLVTSKLLHR